MSRVAWLVHYNEESQGGRRSREARLPLDGRGLPIPWITYAALEFLLEHDFSHCSVFEFGSGNSSQFWAGRCDSIVSVERDPQWYQFGLASLAPNQELLLRETPEAYTAALGESDRVYDVIVVDGHYRYDCARAALARLRRGGMIILDNSDWFGNTCDLLRTAGLIQVDFKGLGPLNSYAWCTSIFLHRDFSIPRRTCRAAAVTVVDGVVQQSEHDQPNLSAPASA